MINSTSDLMELARFVKSLNSDSTKAWITYRGRAINLGSGGSAGGGGAAGGEGKDINALIDNLPSGGPGDLKKVPFRQSDDDFKTLMGDTKTKLEKLARASPLKEVPLKGLNVTQSFVGASRMKGLAKLKKAPTENPVVVRINSKNLLLDGTGRASVAKLRGQSSIKAHFYDAGKIPTDHKAKVRWQEKFLSR